MKNSSEGWVWQVEYPDDSAKLLEQFNRKQQAKILKKIEELTPLQNPISHPQVIPLTESRLRGKFRMKFGDLRIVFSLNTKDRVIQIELIALRKESTYKKLGK